VDCCELGMRKLLLAAAVAGARREVESMVWRDREVVVISRVAADSLRTTPNGERQSVVAVA